MAIEVVGGQRGRSVLGRVCNYLMLLQILECCLGTQLLSYMKIKISLTQQRHRASMDIT